MSLDNIDFYVNVIILKRGRLTCIVFKNNSVVDCRIISPSFKGYHNDGFKCF